MGLDASKAVARARSRSVSRVGRKRTRDAPAGGAEAMDVDGSQAPEQKRIHSAKSRRAPLLPALHPYRRKLPRSCGARCAVGASILLPQVLWLHRR